MSENQFPYFVDWAITEKCNLHCRHCRGTFKGDLSTKRAKELINEIAELHPGWVIVGGGEPLLREDLFELLGLMQKSQLEVHLSTNGTLLNSHLIAQLKQKGIRVMISIDGATQTTYERIRVGASFEKVVQVAQQCAREGLLEAINFTIMKTNYKEIPGIFELAASIGVPQITFIGLKPCHNYPSELLTADECSEAIKLACEARQKVGGEFFFDEPFFWAVVREYGLEAQAREVSTGILVPSTTACIFGEYLFIEPGGDVKPCTFSPMALGNVREKSLPQIWREMLASPLVKQIKDPETRTGYCHTCPYLTSCKGCRSRTFALTGDWFSTDPSCPLSHKSALKERD